MGKYLLPFIIILTSCLSKKVLHTDMDDSLMFQQNAEGQILMSSMNSSQNIRIIQQEFKGDTLFVSYMRGRVRRIKNVLELNENVNYLICANTLYKVNKINDGFSIEKVK